ncbi:MAG: spermidine synthase [Candidatus Limnocylindrales bacterium]
MLPAFGGTSAVWTTALVFFQSTLLAGYAWAHVSLAALGVRRHAVFQVGVVVLVLALLVAVPIGLPGFAQPPAGLSAFVWLPLVLGAMVGVPFLVLSTASPTTQRWFAGLPGRREPYRLFAASNAGSLIGLVAYPTLVEPNLDLTDQARWWTVGFAVFAVATVGAAVAVRRRSVAAASSSIEGSSVPGLVAAEGAPGERRRARWVLLAAVPAALLVGVTTHLSTDVAAVPFLWIVPLTVYLATMILAYLRTEPIGRRLGAVVVPVVGLLVALQALGTIRLPIGGAIALDLVALAAVGLALHGRLAADRPAPVFLTGYSLHVALGGALGGIVAGILAPALLPVPLEPWLVLLVAVGLVPGGRWSRAASAPALAALAVVVVVTVAGRADVLRSDRTFYGYYRVVEPEPGLHVLYSGTTIHGREAFTGPFAGEPLSYYHRAGPLGQVIASLQAERPGLRIGAVGLGAGAIAAYGRMTDTMWFVEIDPAVVSIARDPASFTFLADSAASVDVVVGDGRLELERVAPASFDLLVLDAFSSDAVPVHLLTVEAFRSSIATVAPGGVIAVHISNRYLDLEPVVAAAVRELGLVSIIGTDLPAVELAGLADASQWVIAARSYADVADLVTGDEWRTAHAEGRRAWTDRYSDLLGALRD